MVGEPLGGKLLVIDDDAPSCRLVSAIFAAEGIAVSAAHDAQSGLASARTDLPDVILLDLRLPDMDGLDLLASLRAQSAAVPVIMLTAHGEVRSAVRATQLGAFDYLTKPIDVDELIISVRRALETRALKAELAALRAQVGASSGLEAQMGPSPAVARIMDQVSTVAASSFSVLVLGETGTGKELVAQAIHRQSARSKGPFVALDCGAIPEALLESELFGHEKGAFTGAERRKAGRFQLAEGGTLFLDEVGNLPVALQAKLLRALESRHIQAVGAEQGAFSDVRFVAATNDDLEARVSAGRFRADLFFRLAQYTISLPPLRARPEDVPYLAQRFMEEVSIELRRPVRQIAPDALSALQSYGWPGNVRELRNVIRQAVLESRELVLELGLVRRFLARKPQTKPLAAAPSPGRTLREVADAAAREAERQLICETLRVTRGNKSEAARALKTDYKTLHLKMKSLGIHARDFGPE